MKKNPGRGRLLTTAKPFALALLVLSPGIAPASPTLTTLHSFAGGQEDGEYSLGQLILVRGALYGSTYFGGAAGQGTLFTVDTMTGAEALLHSFTAGRDDGGNPAGGLLYRGGTFYGTTEYAGAAQNGGTVFAYSATKGESLRHSFAGGSDGKRPQDALTYWAGALYATTRVGGGSGCHAHTGCGTIYRIAPRSGLETVLYRFQGGATDGSYPDAPLTVVDGTLFGVTHDGGGTGCEHHNGCGTVFQYDPGTSTYKIVHVFQGGATDGAHPTGALLFARGQLYATTELGGGPKCGGIGCGAILSIDPASGAVTILHAFNNSDGFQPRGGLVARAPRSESPTLAYGTTFLGGAAGKGTIFQVNIVANKVAPLYSFTGGEDGGDPSGPLTYSSGNDSFYGATLGGGTAACKCGTVFQFKP